MLLVIFEYATIAIVGLCIMAILVSVLYNFANANPNKPKKEKRSIVATGTMMAFFVAYYLVLRFRISMLDYNNLYVRVPLIIVSLVVMVFGAYMNVSGRLSLGKNWSDHIKIYRDQTLVTEGMYRYVRHPLYASLIWMFIAGSIIFMNPLSLAMALLIFLPFMYYRAKQEEVLLQKTFKDYDDYRKKTGMFFPKLR